MKPSLFALLLLSLFGLATNARANQQVYAASQLTLAANVPVGVTGLSLVLQSDGNFVAYAPTGAVWSTNTFVNCTSGCEAAFQSDGNLVLYHNGVAYWSTKTYNNPSAQLVISNQAPYVWVTKSGATLWPTGVTAPASGSGSGSGSTSGSGSGSTSTSTPPATTCTTHTCYYIDSVAGSDSNSGISTSTPWKSLASISHVAISAGTSILLKSGSVFSGQQITLTGSGVSGNPVVVSSYGTGALPIITGGAFGVLGQDISYISISNLNITNVSNTGIIGAGNNTNYWTVANCTVTGAAVSGIQARPDYNGATPLRGWIVKNNTIGTVNTAPVTNYDASGILIQGTVGAVISYNTVSTTNTSGIRVQSYQAAQSQSPTISYNTITRNQGGIAVSGTLNAIVTHNWIHDVAGYGVGIGGSRNAQGVYNSTNNVLSYNLLQNLTTSADGVLYNGFDITSSYGGGAYQNTIENVAGKSITLEGDAGPADAWVIRNNILDQRPAINNRDVNLVLFRLSDIPTETFSNNIYMSNLFWIGTIGTDMNAGSDLAIYNVSTWLALGIDHNSLYNQDPLFANVPAENLSIGAASPARNLGATIPGINQVSLDVGALPYGQSSVLAF